MSRLIPGFALCLLLAAPAGGAGPAPAAGSPPGLAPTGRLLASPEGSAAWLLARDGSVTKVDLATGMPLPLAGRLDESERFSDVALAPGGRTLFALAPGADGRTTTLLALDASDGSPGARHEIRGEGRFLGLTPDGRFACVVGLRASSSRRPARERRESAQDWVLTVIDLTSGAASPPLSLGLQPRQVAVRGKPGDSEGARLFATARDRVGTFTLVPAGSSWHYRSPGDNGDLAVPDGPVVYLLRDGALAIIDPERWPRELGRVRLTDDDATTVVPLSAPARRLAISPAAPLLALLEEGGGQVGFVDARTGSVIEQHPIQPGADLIAFAPDGALLLARAGEQSGAVPIVRTLQPPALAQLPAAAPPEPGPPEPAFEEKAAAETPEAIARPVEPEPREPAPASPQPDEPAPSPTEPGEPRPDQPAPSPTEPGEPRPDEPAPAQDGALTGRITGDLSSVREVLLYGPNSIVRLRSRAPVQPDGTFSFPLPEAGAYRLVVSAAPGAYLFTSPPLRSIVVEAGSRGLPGLDFEVKGKL